MTLIGRGFCLTKNDLKNVETEVVHPYLNGRDLLQTSRDTYVIDFFGLKEKEAREKYPRAYQWIYERFKPERDQNNRSNYRDYWWLFGETRAGFRSAVRGTKKYMQLRKQVNIEYFCLLTLK